MDIHSFANVNPLSEGFHPGELRLELDSWDDDDDDDVSRWYGDVDRLQISTRPYKVVRPWDDVTWNRGVSTTLRKKNPPFEGRSGLTPSPASLVLHRRYKYSVRRSHVQNPHATRRLAPLTSSPASLFDNVRAVLVVFLLGDPHLSWVSVVKPPFTSRAAGSLGCPGKRWTKAPGISRPYSYLMEGPKTGQDASADPTGELSLGRVAGSGEANTRPRIHLNEFGVQSFGEAIEER